MVEGLTEPVLFEPGKQRTDGVCILVELKRELIGEILLGSLAGEDPARLHRELLDAQVDHEVTVPARQPAQLADLGLLKKVLPEPQPVDAFIFGHFSCSSTSPRPPRIKGQPTGRQKIR